MKLRKASKNDIDKYYLWANDSECRKNSINQDKIEYDCHVVWYTKKMHCPNSYMYVLVDSNNEIGQVRIDIEDGVGTISYSIASEYRNKGYANKIINLVEKEKIEGLIILRAVVRKSNFISKKVFEKNNYTLVKEIEDEYDVYEKNVLRKK